ncbi:S41 family peptidase [Lutibacter holmesii]|uniref:S41 family peptidase n=1 Tax=Lutibacter holmesii TaxID=1137985 RepID=A0ABW3WNC4_9FLAO
MKKTNYLLLAYIGFALAFASCSKDDDDEGTEKETPDPTEEAVTLNEPKNDFVWKAMNSWYNWQQQVPNLLDSKSDDQDDYYTYLNKYDTPEDLFESLIYNEGVIDRFSWFIEDYVEQQKSFQGISTTFGFRLQAVKIDADKDDVIFYVRYVADNSPAFNAGIKRGDIINALDGVVLTTGNYSETVGKLSNPSVTLTMVSESNGVLTVIEDKTITAVELAEDPVYFKKVFEDINGRKVGYLVYNGFRSSYNDELNEAFAYFKGEGVNELILDFRLNGGGSVQTSAYLASMINESAGDDEFAELKFNFKHTDASSSYYFGNSMNIYDENGLFLREETVNRLSNIDRLYVLTSGSTASASEMIINGLKPFIPVVTVGTTTYGKNVGSITLYDSPSSDYTNVDSANTSHYNAMQPIVFQIYNKSGESDYTQGFEPDIEVVEYNSWNNILPFGDENETVLKGALDHIRGLSARGPEKGAQRAEALDMSKLEKKFEKEMYIDSDFFNK